MNAEIKPWYKQFWPWFIISIPATSVVLGIIMINLAINTDDVVLDDYNKMGKAIVRDTTRDDKAALLELKMEISFDISQQKVTAQFSGKVKPELLFVTFIHPINNRKDIQLPLSCDESMSCILALPEQLSVPRNILVEPVDKSWRLTGKLNNEVQTLSLIPKSH